MNAPIAKQNSQFAQIRMLLSVCHAPSGSAGRDTPVVSYDDSEPPPIRSLSARARTARRIARFTTARFTAARFTARRATAFFTMRLFTAFLATRFLTTARFTARLFTARLAIALLAAFFATVPSLFSTRHPACEADS